MTGRKADDGKLDLTMVAPSLVEHAARVLCFGAEKYDRRNYLRLPDGPHRIYQALRRHLHAFERGEDLDPETGLHHLAHAAGNLAMILHLLDEGRDVGGWRG